MRIVDTIEHHERLNCFDPFNFRLKKNKFLGSVFNKWRITTTTTGQNIIFQIWRSQN